MIGAPCPACKVRRTCPAMVVTVRESMFALAYDQVLGCENFEPEFYHGVEGVIDESSLAGVRRRDICRRNGRFCRGGTLRSSEARG